MVEAAKYPEERRPCRKSSDQPEEWGFSAPILDSSIDILQFRLQKGQCLLPCVASRARLIVILFIQKTVPYTRIDRNLILYIQAVEGSLKFQDIFRKNLLILFSKDAKHGAGSNNLVYSRSRAKLLCDSSRE